MFQADEPAVSEESRLAEWQQGDFSLGCGDFLYLDCAEQDGDSDEPIEAVFDSSTPAGFAVISQTCEIVRDPDNVAHVCVCPLVEVLPERIQDIEKGTAPRFGILPGAPASLVVDFSRTMSISKALLLTWKRERGCLTDHDTLAFGKSIETYFGRFAFPDLFVKCLVKFRKDVVGKYGKAGSDLGKALRSIRELRVRPSAPWASDAPNTLMFIIILEPVDRRELGSIEEIRAQIEPRFEAIEWVGPYSPDDPYLFFTTLGEISAEEYLNSFPLEVNSLSFSKRYTQGSASA